MNRVRRFVILPVLILAACTAEAPPSRLHAVAPFTGTRASLGMRADELRTTQKAAVLRAGEGLVEKIGDDEVIYEFTGTSDSTIADNARLGSISFAHVTADNLTEASAAWVAAVQEMRTALGAPRRCGTIEYSRATLTAAVWAEDGNELLVTLLSDGTSNRLMHSLRLASDSTQLTRDIDCP